MSDSRPAAAKPGAIHTIHDAARAARDEGPLRFDDVDEAIAERVVDALRPYVSEARQQRIESALASRTQAVSVVLEDVHSEHNAAAVLRSADAMGLLEAHLIPRTTGFRVSRKVSIGAHKWLDVRAYPGPEQAYAALRARGVEVWASAIRGQNVPVAEIPIDRPTALVFGNEHEGLSSAAIDMADGRFHIPMTGFVESLNISVAAAITMYDVTRRRREAGQWVGLSEATTRRLRAAWYALSVRAASMILAQAGLPLPLMTPRPLSMQERRSEPCPDPEHPTMGSSASESMP